jgi:hypothetical protein
MNRNRITYLPWIVKGRERSSWNPLPCTRDHESDLAWWSSCNFKFKLLTPASRLGCHWLLNHSVSKCFDTTRKRWTFWTVSPMYVIYPRSYFFQVRPDVDGVAGVDSLSNYNSKYVPNSWLNRTVDPLKHWLFIPYCVVSVIVAQLTMPDKLRVWLSLDYSQLIPMLWGMTMWAVLVSYAPVSSEFI